MNRPSFQFYPGDWQSSSNLRRCTHAEKGAWVDVMCLMHDQPEYGILRWPLKEIAQTIGCSVAMLKALQAKGVMKGDDKHLGEPFVYTPRSGRKDGEPVTLVPTQDGPVWYSSRMVKDEHVRTIRGESAGNGAAPKGAPKGTPKAPPKAAPKPTIGEDIGDGFGPRSAITRAAPSSSSSSSASLDDDYRHHLRDDDVPTDWEAWRRFFEVEHGLASDPYSHHDRSKLRPLATAWANAKVTAGQMRRAIAQAQAQAKEPIAYLPGYVDRVLASMRTESEAGPSAGAMLLGLHAARQADESPEPDFIDMED